MGNLKSGGDGEAEHLGVPLYGFVPVLNAKGNVMQPLDRQRLFAEAYARARGTQRRIILGKLDQAAGMVGQEDGAELPHALEAHYLEAHHIRIQSF